jgi:hypothetical protein
VRLNGDLIPSPSPGSTIGQHYEWLDADAVSGQVYWYQLEAVDVHGGTQVVGSVQAEINSTAAPSKVWLPLVVTP